MSQTGKNTENTNSDEIARSIIQPIVDQAAGDCKGGTTHTKPPLPHNNNDTHASNSKTDKNNKKSVKSDNNNNNNNLKDDQYQKSSSNRNIVFHPDHPERIYELSSTSTADSRSRSQNNSPDPMQPNDANVTINIPKKTSHQMLSDDIANNNLSSAIAMDDTKNNLNLHTSAVTQNKHNGPSSNTKITDKHKKNATISEKTKPLDKRTNSSSSLSREQRRERRRKLEDPNCFPKRFEVQVQARVRVGKDLASQHLTDLPEGSVVTVEEIVDRRARISRPLGGWLSVTSKFGARIILPTNSKYSKIGGKVMFKRPIYNNQATAKVVDYIEETQMYKVSFEDGHTQMVDFEDNNVQFISQHKAVKVQKPLDGAAPTFTLQTSQAFFNQFFCKDYPQYQAQSSSTTRHMDISPVSMGGPQSRFRVYPPHHPPHGMPPATNNGAPHGAPYGTQGPQAPHGGPLPPQGPPSDRSRGLYQGPPHANMQTPYNNPPHAMGPPHTRQQQGPPPHPPHSGAPYNPHPGHPSHPSHRGAPHPSHAGHGAHAPPTQQNGVHPPHGYPPVGPPHGVPQAPPAGYPQAPPGAHGTPSSRRTSSRGAPQAPHVPQAPQKANNASDLKNKTNEEFVNKVKEIERRIIQHLHQRGYDESHPDYHRYLQKAKELAIQKAGKEREKMLAQQRKRQVDLAAQKSGVSKAEYEQYLRYKQEKQRQHAIAEQQRKQRIEAQQRAQQQAAAQQAAQQNTAQTSTNAVSGSKLTSPSKLKSGSVKGLIVLRGLPGSGKTTLAKKLAQRSKNARICTEDRYHWSGKEDGVGEYKFQPQLVFLAREWCTKEIRECIQSNVNLIILDNHNARISMYEDHIQYAVEHGYRFRIIEFVATASLIDRYRSRSYKKFPREVYVKLLKLWENDPRTELINPTFGDGLTLNKDQQKVGKKQAIAADNKNNMKVIVDDNKDMGGNIKESKEDKESNNNNEAYSRRPLDQGLNISNKINNDNNNNNS